MPRSKPDTDSEATSSELAPRAASEAVRAGMPNPQGKGVVGFLQDWHQSAPRGVLAKRSGQLLADYFTSLLVLSADFKFKPAFGHTYHLYREQERWCLSLISPDEWRTSAKRRGYVGACVLHEDSTWSIEPSENLGRPGPVADALAEVYDGFIRRLRQPSPLEQDLPFYEGRLPYYQRLFAAALSRSLRASLVLGGQTGRAAETWLEALPGDAQRLLGHPNG